MSPKWSESDTPFKGNERGIASFQLQAYPRSVPVLGLRHWQGVESHKLFMHFFSKIIMQFHCYTTIYQALPLQYSNAVSPMTPVYAYGQSTFMLAMHGSSVFCFEQKNVISWIGLWKKSSYFSHLDICILETDVPYLFFFFSGDLQAIRLILTLQQSEWRGTLHACQSTLLSCLILTLFTNLLIFLLFSMLQGTKGKFRVNLGTERMDFRYCNASVVF